MTNAAAVTQSATLADVWAVVGPLVGVVIGAQQALPKTHARGTNA